MGELDEATAMALLCRIRQCDDQAFVELFRALNRRIFLFAKHRLDRPEDAEEVLNETMLELWRHPDRFRGGSRFVTYVLGIANNKARAVLRQRGRAEPALEEGAEEDADDGPTPFDAFCEKERRAAIAESMEGLSARQRTIVHLAYFEDLSREEIGRIVGCTGNAVRQLLFQALKKMSRCTAPERPTEKVRDELRAKSEYGRWPHPPNVRPEPATRADP